MFNWLHKSFHGKLNPYVLGITLFFLLIICFILLVPPQIGVADSGDYGRILAVFDLYYIPDYTNFKHFYDTFIFGRPDSAPTYGGYLATTSLFIFLALFTNKIFTAFADTNTLFYLYSLSSVYIVFYLAAFFFLQNIIFEKVPHKIIATIIGIGSALILTDSLFIEYFNSFFQEAGFIVSLLLFVSIFLRYQIFLLDVALLALVIFSKEQNILFFLLIIPIIIKYKGKFNLKKTLIIVAFMTVPMYIFNYINTYAKGINNFDSVYNGLFQDVAQETAATELPKLGLNPQYAIFSSRDYWGTVGELRSSQDTNKYMLWQQAINDSSHLITLHGYLLNPTKLLNNSFKYLQILQKDGPFAPNLGNYKPQYEDSFRVSAFTIFAHFVKYTGFVIVLNLVLLCLIVFLMQKKHYLEKGNDKWLRSCVSLLCMLNAVVLSTIPVNIIGGGFEEPVKHFFCAYYTIGIIFILSILTIFNLRGTAKKSSKKATTLESRKLHSKTV
jgi:hypothetical protein